MIRFDAGQVRAVRAPVYGQQHLGIVPGGPHDRWSWHWATRLCGNAPEDCVLECTLIPPRIAIEADAVVAITGAPARCMVDGHPVPRCAELYVRAGQHLSIEPGVRGCRWYLATPGGWQADGQYWRGGVVSRSLRERRAAWSQVGQWAPPAGVLRVLPGPDFGVIAEASTRGPWQVGRHSDGMGLRLSGPHLAAPGDLYSAPVRDGTIQLTNSGPILLLRERQSMGGYARVLQVIESDIDLAAQLRPGDGVRLDLVDEDEAEAIAAARLVAERTPLSE